MKKYFIITAGCLYSNISHSQQSNYFQSLTQNVVPVVQSPNAAGLGKYGEYPVNESNGVPNVQIPIYNVIAGNISFPISLSYHGSGIKVSEQASWVGLGFSLNAGGVITRKVQGLADDDVSDGQDKGFFRNYQKVQANTGSIWEITDAYPEGLPYMDFKLAVDEGRYDFMPDLFSYNFAGKAGTFTLLPEGEQNNMMLLKTLLTPAEDIKVEATMPLPGKLLSFKITDDNGLIYLFNKVEQNLYNQSTTHPIPAQIGDPSVNTAWYLSLIQDPRTGSQVNFSYEADTIDTDKSWMYQKNIPVPGNNGSCPYTAEVSRDGYSRIIALRLQSISYENTRIDFNAASVGRLDVTGNAKALDNISIYRDNQLVQKHKLITDYFTASGMIASTAKRLKLQKVQQLDPLNSQVIGEYTLDYNGTNLPSRGDVSQHLWGYYRIGATKFPQMTLVAAPNYATYAFSSENRMPGSETIANSLEKITYPTGGSTRFNFENNRYWVEEPVYDVISRTNATSATVNNYATPITTPFTVSIKTKFHFTSILSPSIITAGSSGSPIGPCTTAGSTALYRNGTANAVISFAQNMDFDIELDPGTYHFESVIQQDACTTAMVRVNSKEYKVIGYSHSKIGPGLRIASIENYDQFSNKTIKTEYNYETDVTGHSSGSLFYQPDMISEWKVLCVDNSIIMSDQFFTLHYNDIINSGGVIGPPIYYRQVSKKISGAANGKVVNTYRNQGLPIMMNGVPSFFMAENYKNGQLESSSIYDENGQLKQRKSYLHVFTPSTSNYGFYSYKTINNEAGSGSDQLRVMKYEIKSASVHLAQEVTKEYIEGHEINTTTDYSYNTPTQNAPSTINTTFNDGTKETSEFLFARDYSIPVSGSLSPSLLGIKAMQDNHIFTIPIEQYKAKTDAQNVTQVIAGSLLEVNSTPLAAPAKIYGLNLDNAATNFTPSEISGTSLNKDSRYVEEMRFEDYNTKGKPALMVSRSRNEILLWGYNSRYQTVSIEHADPAAVKIYLSNNPSIQQTLDNPASESALLAVIQQLRTAFPDALISGYTYVPGIGISSVSDANSQVSTYEYDNLGRLLRIKDANGNLIKTYNYQYQN
jgi:YD repeat-containing protein